MLKFELALEEVGITEIDVEVKLHGVRSTRNEEQSLSGANLLLTLMA